jgi:hypothetical protein
MVVQSQTISDLLLFIILMPRKTPVFSGCPQPVLSGSLVDSMSEQKENEAVSQQVDADETTPVPASPMTHVENLKLLEVLGNYCLEAKHHSLAMDALYDELRSLSEPAPLQWRASLEKAMEEHHKADGENLQQLQVVLEG